MIKKSPVKRRVWKQLQHPKNLTALKRDDNAGKLKSNDMSIFLLSLINYCDEETNTIKMRGVASKKKDTNGV